MALDEQPHSQASRERHHMSERQNIGVEGIVAARNQQPYVVLTLDGARAQLTVAAARSIASDLLIQAARIEADAMLIKFFGKMDFPDGALAVLMKEFRDYRSQLDAEKVQSYEVP